MSNPIIGGYVLKYKNDVELVLWSQENQEDLLRITIPPRMAASFGFEMILMAACLDKKLDPSMKFSKMKKKE